MVTAQGERLVSHAGVGMLAETADLSGLTAGISGLFGGHGHVWRAHEPGVSVVQAAASIANGMTNVSGVGQFVMSRPTVFVGAATVSTMRRTVFTFGEELMSAGLDSVMCDAPDQGVGCRPIRAAVFDVGFRCDAAGMPFGEGAGGPELQVRVRVSPVGLLVGRNP